MPLHAAVDVEVDDGWVEPRVELYESYFFAEVGLENEFFRGVSALVLVGLHGNFLVYDFGDWEAVYGFEGVSSACVALADFGASVNH